MGGIGEGPFFTKCSDSFFGFFFDKQGFVFFFGEGRKQRFVFLWKREIDGFDGRRFCGFCIFHIFERKETIYY